MTEMDICCNPITWRIYTSLILEKFMSVIEYGIQ